jgi:hypothetical protein
MLNSADPADRWEVRENNWVDRPLELHDTHQIDLPSNPGTYHRLHISKLGTDEEGKQKWNEYKGRTTLGTIFAEDNTRVDGPHWNELAKAHYESNYDINSLKFVFRLNVVNRTTMPYVDSVLYPRFGLDLMQDQTVRKWAYNTDEYKEILGTTLGKGVGALVLSAFPRGTRRITQIVTWTHQGDLQIRFDIADLREEEFERGKGRTEEEEEVGGKGKRKAREVESEGSRQGESDRSGRSREQGEGKGEELSDDDEEDQ